MSFIFKKHGEGFLLDQKADIKSELPSGVYKIKNIPNVGVFFEPLNIVKDSLIKISNSVTDEVVSFINNFSSEDTKQRYKEVKIVHKTGILLYGPGGTGKTGTVNLIIDDLVKKGAIIFFDATPDLVAAVLPAVREQNPEKLIGVVYEEFDEWLKEDPATINSFLDGQLSVSNMVVLATTNYISEIPARIKNRPSRFQLVKEIGKPSDEFRRAWFEEKLKEIGHSDKLEVFVDQSKDMVIDQMKDMIVSHIALQIPLPDVVKKLQEMSENAVGTDDYVEHERAMAMYKSALRDTLLLPKGFQLKKDDDKKPWK
jgi:hypothetical protein